MKRFLFLVLTITIIGAIGVYAVFFRVGDNPTRITEAWLNAALAGNDATVTRYSCTAIVDESQRASEILGMLNGFTGFRMGGMTITFDESIETELTNMRYTLVEDREQRSVVRAEGNITVNGLIGGSRSAPLNVEIALIREDDRWKVCL